MILSGRDVGWLIEAGRLKIDPVMPEQFRENGVDLILEDIDGSPEYFDPGKFILGCTREILTLPSDLMGFVELRSTWARSGILVPPTIVDAGFHGNLTLELVPFSRIRIPYGQRFAHMIFSQLSSPSIPYKGKYQGQRGITKAKKDNETSLPKTTP